MNLSATFNSIGVEVLFSGDNNASSSATLEFKKTSDSNWKQGLPLQRVSDVGITPGLDTVSTNQAAYYGSALLLDQNTSYDIKVTIDDPDGGGEVKTGTITTRADNIPAASNLTPSHFVRSDGNDGNPGNSDSIAGAWKTLQKAVASAPSGAIVQVGPGYFSAPTSSRSTPITFKAQFPALNDNRDIINTGQHSVIEPVAVSSSAISSDPNDPNKGVWQPVTLSAIGYSENQVATGSALPVSVDPSATIWKWTNSPVTTVSTQMGFSTAREGEAKRVINWRADIGTHINTPEGWAEKMLTNKTYNYGFYWNNKDLYIRMPKDQNPNNFYIKATTSTNAFDLRGDNIRISGFDIQSFQNAVQFNYQAHFGVVDHNLLSANGIGVNITGKICNTAGVTCEYGSDHLIEYNAVLISTLRSSDQINNPSVPWKFIKGGLINADGSTYDSRVGHYNEAGGVGGGGGGKRNVIRRNTFNGSFDAVSDYHPRYDRYAGSDTDVYENLMLNLADDAIDQSRGTINYRIWKNRIENTYTGLSMGPMQYGPEFYFRNEVFNTGGTGINLSKFGENAVGGVIFKYSGASVPTGRVWIINNTIWTNDTEVNGGAEYADPGLNEEALYWRNNILRATKKVFITSPIMTRWDEDYNHFVTSTDNTTYGLDCRAKEHSRPMSMPTAWQPAAVLIQIQQAILLHPQSQIVPWQIRPQATLI